MSGALRALRARAAPLVKRALSGCAAATGLYRLAGARYAGVGVVFTLHRVAEPGRELLWPGYEIHADVLDRLLREIRALGWRCVPLDELHRRLTEGGGDGRLACFTLDDGYEDNLRVALPVFRRNDVPFCVYVATGLVERSIFYWWGGLEEIVRRNDRIAWEDAAGRHALRAGSWPEKRVAYDVLNDLCYRDGPDRARALLAAYGIDWRAALDRDALTREQTRTLAADPLVAIGSHGTTHERLAGLGDEDLRRELEDSRRILEGWTGGEVRHLAYPYGAPGACGPREFEAARRAGYATAVTTRRGNVFAEHRAHLTCLPRREVPTDVVTLRNALYGVEPLLRRSPRFRTD